MRHYKAALRFATTSDAIHGNLGFLYFSKHKYDLALEHFQLALQSNETRVGVFAHAIALSYHYVGNDVWARTFYEIALEEDDKNAQLHFDFAVTLQDQGEVLRANEEYNRAILLNPNFPEVLTVYR